MYVRAGKPARVEFCHGAGPNGAHYERLDDTLRRIMGVQLIAAAKTLTKGIRS